MKRSDLPMLIGTIAWLVMAGCTADDRADLEPGYEGLPETAAPDAAELPATPAPTAVALTTTETAEYGRYVTDQTGRALYLLEDDPQGASNCYDACAATWPPYLAEQGVPAANDPNLQSDLVGTIERRDGSFQVTYAGHPLYYYAEDRTPDQTTGHHVEDQWGEWYLVTPEGQPLEEEESAGDA